LAALRKITLTQFRNYDYQSFTFDSSLVGITGLNGSGKTNLLDAIYYLCYTKSYFQNKESNNIQNGKTGFRIEGQFETGDEEQTVTCIWREAKKSISLNDVPYEKITEHIGRYNAVMIAPDDVSIINEGSELRRRYMDAILAQRDPQYLSCLLIYQKYLYQRNAALKVPGKLPDHQLLDVFDEQLAFHGSYLIREREKLSVTLPYYITRHYRHLSGGKESVSINYRHSCDPERLLEVLKHSRQRDIEYKRTLLGPHTEDWLFYINDNPMKTHASQGQKKSFLISLKISHINLLDELGKQPFLLLDDIFEKLDGQRLTSLFGMLRDFSLPQIFLTHTHAPDLKRAIAGFYNDIQVHEL